VTPTARRGWTVFLVAVAATNGLYQLSRALLHPKQGLDLAPAYVAARLLVDGGDRRFYDDEVLGARARALGIHGPAGEGDPVLNFLYPAWTVLAYVPLSRLPWTAARVAWFFLSAGAVAVSLAWFARALAKDPDEERVLLAAGLLGASFFFPVWYGLMTGQANGLLLLSAAGSSLLLARGRPFAAGLALAPAAFCKPFLALPALVFVAQGAWSALAGLAAGGAALGLLSLAAGGADAFAAWLSQISSHNVLDVAEWRNHGLKAATLALFGRGETTEPLRYLPALATGLFWAGVALAAGLALLSLMPGRGRAADAGLGLGATLVLALLLTPKSWEHYGVFLIPAFLACARAARRLPPREESIAFAVLGAVYVVWAFVFQGKEEYEAVSRGLLVLAFPAKTYASFVLLGLTAWLARRPALSA